MTGCASAAVENSVNMTASVLIHGMGKRPVCGVVVMTRTIALRDEAFHQEKDREGVIPPFHFPQNHTVGNGSIWPGPAIRSIEICTSPMAAYWF